MSSARRRATGTGSGLAGHAAGGALRIIFVLSFSSAASMAASICFTLENFGRAIDPTLYAGIVLYSAKIAAWRCVLLLIGYPAAYCIAAAETATDWRCSSSDAVVGITESAPMPGSLLLNHAGAYSQPGAGRRLVDKSEPLPLLYNGNHRLAWSGYGRSDPGAL